jgi:hypothetical protein
MVTDVVPHEVGDTAAIFKHAKAYDVPFTSKTQVLPFCPSCEDRVTRCYLQYANACAADCYADQLTMGMTLANAPEFKERARLTRLRDAFALRVGCLVDWLCPCPCLSVCLLACMRV